MQETLKSISYPKEFVRILSNQEDRTEINEMIGGVFEVRADYKYEKEYTIWNKDKSDYWYLDYSNCQKLTPIEKDGYRIGWGDEIDGEWVVVGYKWVMGDWRLTCIDKKNIQETSSYFKEYENFTVTKKVCNSEPEQSTEELIKMLEDRGVIQDKKVII